MKFTNEDRMMSTELLTQAILKRGAGTMLAAGMSESAVVRMAEQVSDEYHRRMVGRYEAVAKNTPQ